MLYLEEEHRRRIEEEQQANRERYERKMMLKGYKWVVNIMEKVIELFISCTWSDNGLWSTGF